MFNKKYFWTILIEKVAWKILVLVEAKIQTNTGRKVEVYCTSDKAWETIEKLIVVITKL